MKKLAAILIAALALSGCTVLESLNEAIARNADPFWTKTGPELKLRRVYEVPHENALRKACGERFGYHTLYACTVRYEREGVADIYVRADLSEGLRGCAMGHEDAHRLGLSHDRPMYALDCGPERGSEGWDEST